MAAMACLNLLKNCVAGPLLLYWSELGPWSSTLSFSDTEAGGRQSGMKKKDLNHYQIFSAALVAVVLTFLHGFTQLLVDARVAYLMTFCESVLIFVLLYINPRSLRSFQNSMLIALAKQKSFLVLGVLQGAFVIWTGSYVKNSAAIANRSDSYELILVLAVPATILCMQFFNKFHINATESMILLISGIKLLVLCRDPIFLPTTTTSIICLLMGIARGLFLSMMYSQLHTHNIFTILQELTALKIPVALLLAMYYGEDFRKLWYLGQVSVLFRMAFCSLAKMASILVLLKYSNPLSCVIITNLSWIPLTLIRAFIFKFLFLISTLKLNFLSILDLLVLMFKFEFDRFSENLKQLTSFEVYYL